MFERFTDRARRVLVVAQEEARLLNHNYIGTEHLLLGLLYEGEAAGIAAQALHNLGISLDTTRQKVVETIGVAGSAPEGAPPFTPRAKKVLELSLREALQMGHNYIGTEHILLGLVRESESVGAQVLSSLGVDPARVRQQVIHLLSGDERNPSSGTIGRSASTERLEHHRGQLVACSFCRRRPPASGQLISGRAGAFVCEHCVREWFARLDGQTRDDRSPENEESGADAHFYDEHAQREAASEIDLALTDDSEDPTRMMVRITGVANQPGIVTELTRILVDNSVDVSKINSEGSELGTLKISFTVSKATQLAFMSAYSEFYNEMRGPGERFVPRS